MKPNAAGRPVFAFFFLLLLFFSFFPIPALAKSKPPECVRTVNEKYVCLTIDDGWNKNTISSMLDALNKYNVKCTLFVIGSRLSAMPKVWQRAIQEGHEICYHSMNHKSVLHMSEKRITEDIENWEEAAHKALGKDYAIKRFARLPGGSGSRKENIRRIYAKMGYRIIYWSMDTLSHRRNIVSYIKKKTKGGAIILTHFNGSDQKALPGYIGWLDKNFTLTRISDVMEELTKPEEAAKG